MSVLSKRHLYTLMSRPPGLSTRSVNLLMVHPHHVASSCNAEAKTLCLTERASVLVQPEHHLQAVLKVRSPHMLINVSL